MVVFARPIHEGSFFLSFRGLRASQFEKEENIPVGNVRKLRATCLSTELLVNVVLYIFFSDLNIFDDAYSFPILSSRPNFPAHYGNFQNETVLVCNLIRARDSTSSSVPAQSSADIRVFGMNALFLLSLAISGLGTITVDVQGQRYSVRTNAVL